MQAITQYKEDGILPFFLKSLEKLPKSKVKKAKILVATLKGDVHAISTNLIKIVLTALNYDVLDLGKQAEINEIVYSANNWKAIFISTLLKPTTKKLITLVKELTSNNLSTALLLVGPAINKSLIDKLKTTYKGNIHHCKDLISGIELIQSL